MSKFTLEDLQQALYFAKRGQQNDDMGVTYYLNNQYQKAIECLGEAVKIAEEIGYRRAMGKAFAYMGNAYHRICQYWKCIDCHSKALEIAQENGDTRRVLNAVGNMGNAYYSIGEHQKAIDCFSKTLENVEEFGSSEAVGATFGNMGNAYHRIGQYQKAIDCHNMHLEIAKEIADKRGMATAFGNMGIVYKSIGQYQKAIDCHRNSLNMAEEIRDTRVMGNSLANMGNVYQKISHYQRSIDCYRESMKIAEEVGDQRQVRDDFGNMGTGYHGIGQYQNAIDCYHKSLNISEKIGDKHGVGVTLGKMGNVYLATSDKKKAIDCHSKFLQIAEKNGDILGEAKAQLCLGFCYQENNYRLACSLFAKSILSFQSLRGSLTRQDELNTSMANTFADVHKILCKSLLDLKQFKAALLVSDSGKAKALNDLIRSSFKVVMDTVFHDENTFHAISNDPCSKITEALFDETLAKVIHLMEGNSIVSYAFNKTYDLHAWVISKKGVFHKQWKTTNGLSAKTYLKTVNGRVSEHLLRSLPRNGITIPDFQTLQNVEDDQFIKLAFAGQEQNKANSFTSDLEKRVENLARATDVREVMKREQMTLEVKYVQGKYSLDWPKKSSDERQKDEEKCLGRYSLDKPNSYQCPERISDTNRPANPADDSDRAIVNYLRKKYSIFISPIEEYLIGSKILIVPEGSLFKVPFCAFLNSKNEHLCDRYNLQFTPALHVLNASLLKPLPELEAALFVGNPTVGEVKFADEVMSVSPLLNAALEAIECSEYFSTKPLLEESATKENVLKNMKDASIIHIAAHGHVDHADIFLAPNVGAPNPPTEEHYLLTAKDVLDCTLKARLVVLSCCHSGRGHISAEGVVGIARSFLGAGARSVLVTLWQVPDKPTMEFMNMFYDRVCQGRFVCVALQEAMIELKKKYRMQAWAPFQILGEDIALTKEDIEEIRRQSSLRKASFQRDEHSAVKNN